ncbi:FeoA family protein [Gloeothece verrucosa]|uniref:FeoA family protein n=1 Tax=Gloeothece verrucosa (strain PCC 7822) TaxID=497965 RepID=E0U5K6_GLOV7|nr:FeoA family protein [Gloeothece verrucosa]ADN14719.1 FeoA family protein [Gloeothece verrucosa PCC 7822]
MTSEKRAKKWKFDFIGGSEGSLQVNDELGEDSFFPLTQAKAGDQVWITGLSNTQDIKPLLVLGLQPGNKLEILPPTSGGSIIVSCEGNRIGLSVEIARQIMVTDNSSLLEEI